MAAGIASRAIVGRGAEFAALARPLEAAAEGRSGLVLVTGTSGVGVSRILAETVRRVAGPTSFRVAAGRPRPGRAADPYEPVLAALEPLLAGLSDAELTRVTERGADVLVRLLPGLADRIGAAGVLPERPWTVTPERRQGRVFEALLGTLERLSERVPVLLVLEDLHRADAATRAFTTFLARITRPGRWCIVASYQPDELTRDHPLRADLETIGSAARPAASVDVGPLDRAATAELIGAIEGTRPSAGSLLLVWERSRGNPFLVEELVAARHELSGVDLAGSPEAIIAARLARRSPEARRILRLIAPAGECLSLDQLAAASAAFEVGAERPSPRSRTEPRRGDGGLDGDLRAGLAEAIEHGFLVLRQLDGTPILLADGLSSDDIVELRHERIGRAVVADLLPTQRRRHHAALAVALDEHPEAATRHWLAARILPEARAAALRAAERAGGLDAPDDALARLELAIELGADAVGKRDARTGAALLALAGELAYAGGRAARASAYAESALARLDEKADRLAAAAEQIRLGRALRLRGDLEGSLVAQRRAVDLVPRTPSVERARVLGALAQSLMLDGHFAESERLAQEAIRTARAVGEDGRGAEAHATTTLGIARAWGADPSEALALLEAAGELAEAAGDLDERFRAMNNRITTLHLLGRRDDSIALALAGIEDARRYGMETVYGNFLRGNVAEVLFAVGRWSEAAEMARTALEWSPAGPAFVEPAVFLATVRIEQRADEEAAALLGKLLLQLELFPDPQYVIPASRAAASFALWRGDVADAARAIELGWETVRRTEDWIQVAATAATVLEVVAATVLDARERRDLARVADARDRGARVLAEAERIVRAAGPSAGPSAAGPSAADPAGAAASSAAPEAAAWLATARADHARALDRDDPRIWAAVAKTWARVGNPYQVARARWREALAILETAGDARAGRARARDPLLESVRIARELGARPLLRELLALATRALIRVPEAEGVDATTGPGDGETSGSGGAAGGVGVPVGPGRRSGIGVGIAVGSEVPAGASAVGSTGGGIVAALVGPSAAAPRDTFGLSNREREVLGLIVEGRTNREIGERLFISQKTVGVHVGNILAKLGVSGRVEAATVALRLELTAKG